MGRYRPPTPKGSAVITPEGAQKLQEELNYLWKEERPKVTHIVHEAAKNGDRSENGDYIYGKKRLREIDSRVRFLRKRLEEVEIVDYQPSDPSKVYFGSWVTLEDEKGEENTYQIVGPDEFNVKEQKISIDSPLAKALLGKKVDGELSIETPQGIRHYLILKIQYKSST